MYARKMISEYRLNRLQGRTSLVSAPSVEGLTLSDFMFFEPLEFGIRDPRIVHALRRNYAIEIDNYSRAHSTSLQNTNVLKIRRDETCSARTIIFSVLIAASYAIKNHTVNETALRESLTLILEDTQELEQLYEESNPVLVSQTQTFKTHSYMILCMIHAVLTDEISTTELIYQANKDACEDSHTPLSILNVALSDLVHYMLYKEAKIFIGRNSPGNKSDEDQYKVIKGSASLRGGKIQDFLKPECPYTSFERGLVYQHLKLNGHTIDIDLNCFIKVLQEGDARFQPSLFIIAKNDYTGIIIDLKITRHIEIERSMRAQFTDPEQRFYQPNHAKKVLEQQHETRRVRFFRGSSAESQVERDPEQNELKTHLDDVLKTAVLTNLNFRKFKKAIAEFIPRYDKEIAHSHLAFFCEIDERFQSTEHIDDRIAYIKTFLLRVQRRLLEPIPNIQYRELQRLKTQFQRINHSTLQDVKYHFLTELENKIISNPTLIYADCVQAVQDQNHLFIRAAGRGWFWGGGHHGAHQTYSFIQNLCATEPSELIELGGLRCATTATIARLGETTLRA